MDGQFVLLVTVAPQDSREAKRNPMLLRESAAQAGQLRAKARPTHCLQPMEPEEAVAEGVPQAQPVERGPMAGLDAFSFGELHNTCQVCGTGLR